MNYMTEIEEDMWELFFKQTLEHFQEQALSLYLDPTNLSMPLGFVHFDPEIPSLMGILCYCILDEE